MRTEQGVYHKGGVLDSGEQIQGADIHIAQEQTVQRADSIGVVVVQIRQDGRH